MVSVPAPRRADRPARSLRQRAQDEGRRMRRAVKVLAYFLGAAKELTGEDAELAEITEDEQNQIRMSLTSRPDRKQAVKFLAKKGLTAQEIAEQTGWTSRTIERDLAAIKAAGASINVGGRTDKCWTSAIDDGQRKQAERQAGHSRRGNARQPARRQAGDQGERHAAAPLPAGRSRPRPQRRRRLTITASTRC